MSGLQWKNPPARGKVDWDSLTEQLKANPNKWALVASDYGHNRVEPATRRGLTVRTNVTSMNPRRFDVYAKWVAA